MSANLAKIHIAKKDLGLTDDEYRSVIAYHFAGKTSASQLNPRQQTVLLNHFRAKGWQPKSPVTVKEGRTGTKRANDNYRKIQPGPAANQQRYILALWNKLGYELKKLDARCHQQFGIDRLEWVTAHEQLRILITDLKTRCEAAGLSTERE